MAKVRIKNVASAIGILIKQPTGTARASTADPEVPPKKNLEALQMGSLLESKS